MPRVTNHPGVALLRATVRGRKVWQIRWLEPDGSTRRRVIGPVAEVQRADAEREAVRQSLRLRVGASAQTSTSPADAFSWWLGERTKELRPETIEHYRRHLGPLLERIPLPETIERTTPDDLARCRAFLIGLPVAIKTRNNRIAALKAWINWLRRQGATPELTGSDVNDRLYLMPQDQQRPRFHGPGELRAVVEGIVARDSDQYERWGPALLVLLLTGLRAEEFCNLTWEAVELDNERLDLTRTKTRRPRWVDLSICPTVGTIIGALPRIGEFVWSGRQPMSKRRVKRWFELLEAYQGIPRSGPQLFRRTCSTYRTALVGFEASARSMGHTIEVAQQRYVGLVRLRDNPATLEAAMGIDDLAARIAG